MGRAARRGRGRPPQGQHEAVGIYGRANGVKEPFVFKPASDGQSGQAG